MVNVQLQQQRFPNDPLIPSQKKNRTNGEPESGSDGKLAGPALQQQEQLPLDD